MGHKSSLVQRNKPFKNSTKRKRPESAKPAVKVHVIEGKDARRQRSAALRRNKTSSRRLLVAQNPGAVRSPRLIAFLPLHASVDLALLGRKLLKFIFLDLAKNKILSAEAADAQYTQTLQDLLVGRIVQLPMPAWCREADHLQFVITPRPSVEAVSNPGSTAQFESLINALDVCKTADIVIPVYADITVEDAGFDRWGNELTSLLQKQGVPVVAGVAINGQFDKASRSFVTAFGRDERIFDLSSSLFETDGAAGRKDMSQLLNFLRHLATVSLPALTWRESQRGYALVNCADVKIAADAINVQCYVRGLGVNVNSPIHISGVGDFTLQQIAVRGLKGKSAALNSPVVVEELQNVDAYAKAWTAFGTGELPASSPPADDGAEEAEESDEESTDGSEIAEPESDHSLSPTDDEEGSGSAYFDDSGDAEMRGNLQTRVRADMEVEDEVDTPNDVPARTRFAKYRGLKSFKNSNWDILSQDQNPHAAKLFQLTPYKTLRAAIAAHYRQALIATSEKARAATRGCKYQAFELTLVLTFDEPQVREAKIIALQRKLASSPNIVLSTMTLLERKTSVQHFAMHRFGDAAEVVVPKKSEILLQCGFRRVCVLPLFSLPAKTRPGQRMSVELNKVSQEKLASQRYLRHGLKDCSIFSAVGPAQQFPDPTIAWFLEAPCTKLEEIAGLVRKIIDDAAEGDVGAFTEAGAETLTPRFGLALASGRFVTSDPERLVIKKIVMTGYPHKISGRRATVCRMFMNRGDVEYFKNVALTTKKGKVGKITEPLGLHGAMKCYFEEPVEHAETVCLPLYKREFPPFSDKTFLPPPL